MRLTNSKKIRKQELVKMLEMLFHHNNQQALTITMPENDDVITLYPVYKENKPDHIYVEGACFPMSGKPENVLKDLINYKHLIQLRTDIDNFCDSLYNKTIKDPYI